jgi:hypothetical protein
MAGDFVPGVREVRYAISFAFGDADFTVRRAAWTVERTAEGILFKCSETEIRGGVGTGGTLRRRGVEAPLMRDEAPYA